ncbi:MAG: tetratricopeptide repeat protein [Pseudomonadota bacterium]
MAELEPAVLPTTDSEIPDVSMETLAGMYQEVLLATKDAATRVLVLERLAGLDMAAGESALADAGDSKSRFQAAIAAYESLLAEQPSLPQGDRMLYQLSKAHDLTGNGSGAEQVLARLAKTYPNSDHVIEARFRLAESHFSAGRYALAEADYAAVIAAGEDSDYFVNATYMLAWSQFKQARYRQSIRGFTETLDQLLVSGPGESGFEQLEAAQRSVADDCLRVLAFVFSYLEGSETIDAAYDQLGERHYMPLLYNALAELYLSQERFQDSVDSFRAYIARYPTSPQSHRFQLRVINIYESAGFPDQVLAEKGAYVAGYGVSSDYYLTAQPALRAEMRERLTQFIEELATYHHALAQADHRSGVHYREAAHFYQLYIDSFPEDHRAPELGFLLAEVLSELGQMRESIARFEWVSYEFPEHPRAADAGYAALLGYERLKADTDKEERATLAQEKSYSQLRFAAVFTEDSRRTTVLSNAADELLSSGQYRLSLIAAAALLRDTTATDRAILAAAQLVEAHAWFELQSFADASAGYQLALQTLPEDDPLWQTTVERLAASLYREAERVAEMGDAAAAARAFERITEQAPEASFRRQAQYDAAAYYMQAQNHRRANQLLLDFRSRYPGDALLGDLQEKLIFNHEQLSEWGLAARELDAAADVTTDTVRQGQLIYAAAEHYDRAGERDIAIVRFRRYAHGWEQPLTPRFEAMRRLAELYEAGAAPAKQRFWLRKIIAAHDAAGTAQTSRSLYLTAQAAALLAEVDYQVYAAVPLAQPLKVSLRKKQRAMQSAIAAFQRCDSYGVADFSAQCTYRMGVIYAQLAEALLASPRPDSLEGLALEQYELLLEEQAFPFEEKAIAIHETNVRRSWQGWYDRWVALSFDALAQLSPVRYAKRELVASYAEGIY